MRPQVYRVAAWVAAAAVLCAVMYFVSLWVNWMVNQDREKFEHTCQVLNAEAEFETDDWLCIRDGDVVYPP